MLIQSCVIVSLNPVTEANIVDQYKADEGWIQTSECTAVTVFECATSFIKTDAVYIPSNKEEE